MRVAVIGTYNTQDTGPSRVTGGLADGLAKNGINVDIYSHGDREEHPFDGVSVENYGETPRSVRGFLDFARMVNSDIRGGEYDLVHPLEEYPYSTQIRTIQWTIESYQNWKHHREAFPGYRFLTGDILLNLLNRIGCVGTEHIVAISPETKSQLFDNLLLSVDDVIPLGVNEEELTPPSRANDKTRILLTGWIERKKGQKRVLDCLDPEDDSYQVDIVGGVKDEVYFQELKDWHHRYHGFVSRERFNELHEAADIVVIPSYHDPYPTTGIEAIANGCSVVITDGCGFAQFDWAKPENGIHVVKDGQEAARKVEELSQRDLTKEQWNAYKLARTMTWENVAKQYIDLYKCLLE